MAELEIGDPVDVPDDSDTEPYELPLEEQYQGVWDEYFAHLERIVLGSMTPLRNASVSVTNRDDIVTKQDPQFSFNEAALTIEGDVTVSRQTRAMLDISENAARAEDAHTQALLRDTIRSAGMSPDLTAAYISNMDTGVFRDVAAIEYLEDYTVELVNKKADDVFQKARPIISESMAKGRTFRETADVLHDSITEFSGKRSMVIARTEMVRAANEGRISGYKRNRDVLAGWESSAFFDERTGELDMLMDGATWDITGTPVSGGSLSHPDARIPYHPLCRCAAIPILKDPDDVEFEIP